VVNDLCTLVGRKSDPVVALTADVNVDTGPVSRYSRVDVAKSEARVTSRLRRKIHCNIAASFKGECIDVGNESKVLGTVFFDQAVEVV
jgi:hypothetical protein